MTTHNSRNAGRVYIMVSCAAPEGVYTQRPVLLLDMSTLQRAVLHLHLDMSTPQRPELHLDLSTLQRPALLLEVDLSTLQRAVQLLEVSTLRGLSCLWTCLQYTSVLCAGPGLHKGDRQQHPQETSSLKFC